MRKVGCSEVEEVGGRLELYRGELERQTLQFEGVVAARGLVAALQDPSAERVAQYGEVVRILQSAGEGAVLEASEAMRSDETPRWRRLALALVLGVLAGRGSSVDG